MTKKQTKADRQKIADEIQASNALEGYPPLTPNDGVPYELQRKWIDGKITQKEHKQKLIEHFGLKE